MEWTHKCEHHRNSDSNGLNTKHGLHYSIYSIIITFNFKLSITSYKERAVILLDDRSSLYRIINSISIIPPHYSRVPFSYLPRCGHTLLLSLQSLYHTRAGLYPPESSDRK